MRSQIGQHGRLIRRWFVGDKLDRVLLDNTIRQLPLDARRTLAIHHLNTVDKLICQLENWQVARQLSGVVRPPPRAVETRRDGRGMEPARWVVLQRPQIHPPVKAEWRCFSCGQTGHIARQCRDVSMPSAYAGGDHVSSPPVGHIEVGGPNLPARVEDQDTQALIDTGSVVTLLRPDLARQTGEAHGGRLRPWGHPNV